MNLLVVGSMAYDYIMNFSGKFADRIMEDKIHSLSLSFLVDDLKKQFGGTAGNIAYSSKLLGIQPYIFSQAGNDFNPYKKFLKHNKIPTKYIKEYENVSMSSYFVVTDTTNNQIGSFYTGAIQYGTKYSISIVTEKIPYAIIAPTNPQAMVQAAATCKKLAIPYIYDPAFQIAVFSKEELQDGIFSAAILIGNDYEIGLIENKLEIAHEELIAKVPVLITTLGSKGSIIETQKESIHIKPATIKKDIDPTGAGDAYRAGLIAGILRGYPLDVAAQMGSVAAAYTVELHGTQTHSYTKKDFIQRYKQNYQTTIRL